MSTVLLKVALVLSEQLPGTNHPDTPLGTFTVTVPSGTHTHTQLRPQVEYRQQPVSEDRYVCTEAPRTHIVEKGVLSVGLKLWFHQLLCTAFSNFLTDEQSWESSFAPVTHRSLTCRNGFETIHLMWLLSGLSSTIKAKWSAQDRHPVRAAWPAQRSLIAPGVQQAELTHGETIGYLLWVWQWLNVQYLLLKYPNKIPAFTWFIWNISPIWICTHNIFS